MGASASRTAHGMWPSDVHRLQQIRRMNRNLSTLRRRIATAANAGEKEIQKAFELIAGEDTRMATKILGMPDTLSVSSNAYLKNILQAQALETMGRMENLANSTVSSDAYRRAVDTAVSAVQSGVEDYGSAIRRSIREAGQMGLRVRENGTTAVEYASGHTRRLDSAVRMNILDGVRHLNQSIMDEVGRQLGADGIEIDAHMLCAEDHLPYQGRQFSNADFEQIQSSLPRPFGEWNCRHSWHPILLGISRPAFTDDDLRAMQDYSTEQIEIDGRTKTRYQWSQEMRRLESAVRQQKDTATMAKAAGDTQLERRCKGTILQLNEKYKSVADQAGLKPEFQRTFVQGYRDGKAEGGLTRALSAGNMDNAGGELRNTEPLTDKQYQDAFDFAVQLGCPAEIIQRGRYQDSGFNENFNLLIIGRDIYPNPNGKSANARMSYRAGIAHEVVGHRETCMRKTNFERGSTKDEAQASYRASLLTPGLTQEERNDLLQDAKDRLAKSGQKLEDVIGEFDLGRLFE